jgi:hypothetical protein
MKTVDFSSMIVLYNFTIGILLMLSSEKIALFAGHISRSKGAAIARFTCISTFTFGACVSSLSGAIYLLFHILRIGM